MSPSLSDCPSICLSDYRSERYPCVCLTVSLCVHCLYICVSVHKSVYESVCFAFKVIAVVGLQLLWFEKQDPASLLTHILPDTRQQPLNSCQSWTRSRPPSACTARPGQPGFFSQQAGGGGVGVGGAGKERLLQGSAIKESAAGLRECEEAVLVKRAHFNGTGKNNFNLRSMCVCGNRQSARVIHRARRQEKGSRPSACQTYSTAPQICHH